MSALVGDGRLIAFVVVSWPMIYSVVTRQALVGVTVRTYYVPCTQLRTGITLRTVAVLERRCLSLSASAYARCVWMGGCGRVLYCLLDRGLLDRV